MTESLYGGGATAQPPTGLLLSILCVFHRLDWTQVELLIRCVYIGGSSHERILGRGATVQVCRWFGVRHLQSTQTGYFQIYCIVISHIHVSLLSLTKKKVEFF